MTLRTHSRPDVLNRKNLPRKSSRQRFRREAAPGSLDTPWVVALHPHSDFARTRLPNAHRPSRCGSVRESTSAGHECHCRPRTSHATRQHVLLCRPRCTRLPASRGSVRTAKRCKFRAGVAQLVAPAGEQAPSRRLRTKRWTTEMPLKGLRAARTSRSLRLYSPLAINHSDILDFAWIFQGLAICRAIAVKFRRGTSR